VKQHGSIEVEWGLPRSFFYEETLFRSGKQGKREAYMSKITELTAQLARPVVEANGCSLWDVEYVKEAGSWYLRIYIDKEEGVSIDDCEAVSRAVSDLLDEADPIQDPYTFEVSSAGADRALKKPEHFAAFLGAEVDVKFYKAVNGQKSCTGILTGYEDGNVSLNLNGEAVTLEKKDVAFVRLHVSF
jgi:ribosome maturation factor RimP